MDTARQPGAPPHCRATRARHHNAPVHGRGRHSGVRPTIPSRRIHNLREG